MTTKQQERDALNEIRKIVAGLGEDSYLNSAFDGAFSLAEQNIEYDAAFTVQYYIDQANKAVGEARTAATETENLKKKIASLEAQLEKEQEWKPYESDRNVKQADYISLATAGGTRILSDEEAKDLIAQEFGFDRSKITIHHRVDKEEVSRHRYTRKAGEVERLPVYNATDWNYIRFDCACWFYEMHNGHLSQFYC